MQERKEVNRQAETMEMGTGRAVCFQKLKDLMVKHLCWPTRMLWDSFTYTLTLVAKA